MLNITNVGELYSIMDADEDGTISEDEQVLMFSVIKEKMAKVAEGLCSIQEYVRYRDLMKAIRKLEYQIAKYQDFFRQRIYKSEIDVYHQLGEGHFDKFYEYYEKEFKDLNTYSLERETQLRAQHEDQLSNLLDRLDRATQALKFKPKPELKEYQTQEKLVSIDERVEEAMNFRKELKDLEVSEAQRINKMRIDDIEKQRNELIAKQRKEMIHLQSKLKNEENKLIIRMKRDYDILKKKTSLHENEIKKIQGLAAKFAMQKALHDGELRRGKDKSRKMNDILGDTKGISTGGFTNTTKGFRSSGGYGSEKFSRVGSQQLGSGTMTSTDIASKTTAEFIKTLSKSPNVIQFYLKKSYGEEPPVNVKPVNYAHEDKLSHKKVEIYLHNKTEKKNEIPALTSLYDNELKLIEQSNEDNIDTATDGEKRRRKQFINEKMIGDKRIAM
jgi:hypothetical protein